MDFSLSCNIPKFSTSSLQALYDTFLKLRHWRLFNRFVLLDIWTYSLTPSVWRFQIWSLLGKCVHGHQSLICRSLFLTQYNFYKTPLKGFLYIELFWNVYGCSIERRPFWKTFHGEEELSYVFQKFFYTQEGVKTLMERRIFHRFLSVGWLENIYRL